MNFNLKNMNYIFGRFHLVNTQDHVSGPIYTH